MEVRDVATSRKAGRKKEENLRSFQEPSSIVSVNAHSPSEAELFTHTPRGGPYLSVPLGEVLEPSPDAECSFVGFDEGATLRGISTE